MNPIYPLLLNFPFPENASRKSLGEPKPVPKSSIRKDPNVATMILQVIAWITPASFCYFMNGTAQLGMLQTSVQATSSANVGCRKHLAKNEHWSKLDKVEPK